MTRKEARQHFEWFTSQIPERMCQLKKIIAWTSGMKEDMLDFSPESLLVLWEWVSPLVEVQPKSPQQIAMELQELPEWFHEDYLENTEELTLKTLSLVMDVGIYFGEVFIKENPQLAWGFVSQPKALVHVNRPIIVLQGSSFQLDPRNLVYIQVLKTLRHETKKEALLNLYEIWKKDLRV